MTANDDLNEIAAVIYRYSTAMDSREWRLMDDVFAEDATSDMGGYLFPRGRAQIVRLIRAAIECCSVTHHMNSNIEAVIDGDRARVTNKFQAWHRGRDKTAHLTYEAMGTYTDEFVRTPSGWRIRHRIERNPIETWGAGATPGSQEIFFADAMPVFAECLKVSD